jgi:hypothetical protein
MNTWFFNALIRSNDISDEIDFRRVQRNQITSVPQTARDVPGRRALRNIDVFLALLLVVSPRLPSSELQTPKLKLRSTGLSPAHPAPAQFFASQFSIFVLFPFSGGRPFFVLPVALQVSAESPRSTLLNLIVPRTPHHPAPMPCNIELAAENGVDGLGVGRTEPITATNDVERRRMQGKGDGTAWNATERCDIAEPGGREWKSALREEGRG